LRENALKYDGALQVFRDTDPRWSFARINEGGDVVETAEKKAISDLASTGLYYFKSWMRYMDYYQGLELSGGEKYVAPIYNQLLDAGLRVGIIPCKKYLCFGTPADYESCRAGKHYSF
jgi:dTDP-glucose pyrophosphorylase